MSLAPDTPQYELDPAGWAAWHADTVRHAKLAAWNYIRTKDELTKIVASCHRFDVPMDEALAITREALMRLFPADHRDKTSPPSTLTIPQILAHLTDQGAPIPTGFPPIDRQLRGGGMRAGRILVVGGPPEAGKTTLICQLLSALAAQNLPVFCLFKDEGMEQAAVRICQQRGHDPELLEKGDAATIGRVAASLGEQMFEFLDPDAPGMSLEAALAGINARSDKADGPRVLALDSVQTISPFSNPGKNPVTMREQVTSFMDEARKYARAENLLVIASSKVNRGFYQRKDPKERNTAAASFSDSAALEYGTDVAVVIHPSNDEGISRVEWAKNRLRTGRSITFSVRVDHDLSRVVEVDQAAAEEEGATTARASVRRAEEAILGALKANRTGLLAGALVELAGKGINRQAFFAARAALLDRHTIFTETEGRFVRFLLTLSED